MFLSARCIISIYFYYLFLAKMYEKNLMNSDFFLENVCETQSLFCWISAFSSTFSHFKLHECLLQSFDVLN